MSNPLKNLVLTGYVGVQGGNVKSTKLRYTDAGVVLGGEITSSKNGAFLRGQVGAGTAFSGKVQAGYDFDLGKNMGLELSAKAQIGQSVTPAKINIYDSIADMMESGSNMYYHDVNSSSQEVVKNLSQASCSFNVPNGEKKIGAQAMLKYNGKKFDAGIGFEGGMHESMLPDIELKHGNTMQCTHGHTLVDTNVVFVDTLHNENELSLTDKPEGYVTPTGFVSYKPTKDLSIKLEGDIYEQHLGIEYKLHSRKAPERPWYGN